MIIKKIKKMSEISKMSALCFFFYDYYWIKLKCQMDLFNNENWFLQATIYKENFDKFLLYEET